MTLHQTSLPPQQPQAHFRPKPDGASDPAGEAGWYLQREREMRGVSLDKAGQDTGIHPHHLEAIEMGDLERLPERGQALRMIGAYARYLGFDPQPLTAHFARLMPRPLKAGGKMRAFSSATVISFPLIRRLRSMTSGGGGVVASVLAAVVLFGGVIWAVAPGGGNDEIIVSADQEQAAPAATGEAGEQGVRAVSSISRLAEEALGDAAPAASGVDSMAELIKRTATGDIAPSEAPAAAKAAPRPPAPAPAASDPAASAPPAAPGEGFVLRARDDIWVRIEDRDGQTIYSGMLKKGDTYTVPAAEGLTIIARDGGLLEWAMNGKVMGPLAKPGTVLVGEPLSPEALGKSRG